MHNVLHEKYYNIGETERYLVQTCSQTKSSGIKHPEVHAMRKNLDPNILPENQHTNPITSGTDSLIQNMFWLQKTSFQALWALHQAWRQPNNNALYMGC